MFGLAFKMTFARKGRLVLTSLAVILGTAFLSGTYVFRDTINQTFDRLFSDIFRDVDHCSFSTQGPWLLPPNRPTSCDLQVDNIHITGSNRPGCPPCIADHNRDGGVDGADIEAFFADWDQSLRCGDSNEDGGVDAADVITFITRWQEGDC